MKRMQVCDLSRLCAVLFAVERFKHRSVVSGTKTQRRDITRVGLGLGLVLTSSNRLRGKSTLQSRITLQPRSMGFNGQNLNFLSIVPWTGLEPRGAY